MASRIGGRIAFYLELSGLSQKQLAEKAGVTEAAISRYINGLREPRAITVAAIARALGVSVNDITETGTSNLEEAFQMVARNAKEIPEERRKQLIKILLDC